MKSLFNIFVRRAPSEMFITMLHTEGTVFASKLARKINVTYSHTVKILQVMEYNGLVSFEIKGRCKFITLTEKGRSVANHLNKLKVILTGLNGEIIADKFVKNEVVENEVIEKEAIEKEVVEQEVVEDEVVEVVEDEVVEDEVVKDEVEQHNNTIF